MDGIQLVVAIEYGIERYVCLFVLMVNPRMVQVIKEAWKGAPEQWKWRKGPFTSHDTCREMSPGP